MFTGNVVLMWWERRGFVKRREKVAILGRSMADRYLGGRQRKRRNEKSMYLLWCCKKDCGIE